MAYYRKNKRRFDPRYFMNERLEEGEVSEMVVDGPSQKFVVEPPEIVGKRLKKALAQKADADREEFEDNAMHHLDASYEDQAEVDARNRQFDAIGGCGTEQTYFVDIGIGRAEFDDLNALIQTAQTWQNSGIDIVDASPEVLEALGLGGAEQLPNLMDEEPPLEE